MSPTWLNPAWKPASNRETVVLIHGALVDGWEMLLLRWRLKQLGYRTAQFRYRSMTRGIDENAALLSEFIRQTEGDTLHVIGHSMGGVLVRQVFEQTPDPRPGRLIAIGSPLLDVWIGHRISAMHSLGYHLIGKTVFDHIHRQNSPVWQGTRDFGVIAGTYPMGIGRIFADLPPGSDGTILWDETRLQGLRDHVTINLNHFSMLFSRRCAAFITRFLATGQFTEEAPLALETRETVARETVAHLI